VGIFPKAGVGQDAQDHQRDFQPQGYGVEGRESLIPPHPSHPDQSHPGQDASYTDDPGCQTGWVSKAPEKVCGQPDLDPGIGGAEVGDSAIPQGDSGPFREGHRVNEIEESESEEAEGRRPQGDPGQLHANLQVEGRKDPGGGEPTLARRGRPGKMGDDG
jgi:hypothetical protein